MIKEDYMMLMWVLRLSKCFYFPDFLMQILVFLEAVKQSTLQTDYYKNHKSLVSLLYKSIYDNEFILI